MTIRCLPFVLMVAILARALAAADPVEVKSPLEPAEAQKLFQLADANLRIELAAAEPEVIDPVAIRFDEGGRMWVCEMRDYPTGPPPGSGKTSRIRVLDDADGDGRFEKTTTFADGLSFVTGLQPWKGGVFVTLSGAVAYMKDTDGNGKCDLDETWFEGFAEQNTQLRANHPRLALDNWIYVANGLRGGKVVSRKLKEQGPIDISGMDFRFDPLTGKAEAVSGNGQFGLTFDDWGNRFICSNRNPCMHVVIEDRYLKANPGVTVPAVVHNVAAFAENSRIYPISRAWTTSNLHAGQFTAACGVYIYRGDLLPPEFYGNVFTCDPTGNLVHREIIQPAGPTFTSKPAYEGKEFLASPDEWFRPVNMELGPDGALYVVDMYRAVIEHPDWVPDELKKRPDERFGDDRGRIWRIVPKTGGRGRERWSQPPFGYVTQEMMASLIEDENAWQRETAQRLILESGEFPRYQFTGDARTPQGRVHALWTLKGLGKLESGDLLKAFKHPDASVRRQACILAEGALEAANLCPEVRKLTLDLDDTVRFQARWCWRLVPGNRADFIESSDRLVNLARADSSDGWMRAAFRANLHPTGGNDFAKYWLGAREAKEMSADERQLLIEICNQGSVVHADQLFEEVTRLLQKNSGSPGAIGALLGLLRGLARQGIPLTEVASLEKIKMVREILSAQASGDSTSTTGQRDLIEILGFFPDAASVLVGLTSHGSKQEIRTAAVASLARQAGSDHWQSLLDTFPAETPPIRRAILDGLLANSERTKLLLNALEAGKIKPSELEAAHVTRLSQHKDAGIKERAGKLFAAATPAERAKALADYQPVLTLQADAKRGQAIFEKNCAACHKIGGIGTNVAPDISDSRTKKLDQLLGDILLPNRAIDNNYIGYNVRLLDGTVATGVLSAETSTSITLRQQGGKEAVISRSEIEELKSSGQSLMPEGLERQIPHQEMADLLSFIKNWRYLDGRTPLSPQ
jgi:putative membrane-bound dehydrogenase-like protein